MADPQIPILGIGSSWRKPGAFSEIRFAQGATSAGAGEREVVFVMPMLSTGTWTAGKLYRVYSSGEAETGGSAGSPIHRGISKFFDFNKDAKVWALPVAETSDGAPAAATSTHTFVTDPTGTGSATVWVCGEACSYGYTSSDTVTTVAARIKAAINAKSRLPVTADNAAGVLTITAKLQGVSQGTATVPVISVRSEVSAGTGITATDSGAWLGAGAGVDGADGTTTEADNTATALATIANVRKYYSVSSANDATTLGHFETHIATKTEPRRGLRSVAIAAYPGTLANCTTITNGLNYERVQVAWLENPDNDCAEIAGRVAAERQKLESLDATFGLFDWPLNGLSNSFDTADWPSDIDINDAINDGIAVIQSTDAGPLLVMNLNTRSKNAAGTQDDFRACECHRISGPDLFTDESDARWRLNYANKKLEDDEILPAGSGAMSGRPNPNKTNRPGVIRPSIYKGDVKQHIQEFYDRGHIRRLQEMKDSVLCRKSGSRVETSLNFFTIDHALQRTLLVAESSEG
jgi:phage tail sheath gpL-like